MRDRLIPMFFIYTHLPGKNCRVQRPPRTFWVQPSKLRYFESSVWYIPSLVFFYGALAYISHFQPIVVVRVLTSSTASNRLCVQNCFGSRFVPWGVIFSYSDALSSAKYYFLCYIFLVGHLLFHVYNFFQDSTVSSHFSTFNSAFSFFNIQQCLLIFQHSTVSSHFSTFNSVFSFFNIQQCFLIFRVHHSSLSYPGFRKYHPSSRILLLSRWCTYIY